MIKGGKEKPLAGKLTKPVASNGFVTRSHSATAPLKVQLEKSYVGEMLTHSWRYSA